MPDGLRFNQAILIEGAEASHVNGLLKKNMPG
jgi:hypothetical protein